MMSSSSNDQRRGSRFGIGIAAALLIVAAAIIVPQLLGGRESGAGPVPKSAFYTDDNGKSSFKDDINKMSPFDRGGKQAYRCNVFQDSSGKQFVGLIFRHTDSGRREMEAYLPNESKDFDGSTRRGIEDRGMQVKPPAAGDQAWVPADETTVTQLQTSLRDAAGKPVKLVQP